MSAHSRLVCEDPKTLFFLLFFIKTLKNFLFFLLAIISDTLFHQKSPAHQEAWFPEGDNIQLSDIATYRLNRPRDQFSEKLINQAIPEGEASTGVPVCVLSVGRCGHSLRLGMSG